jgi:hypothetical protein
MPTFDPQTVTQAFQRLFATCPLPSAMNDPREALRAYLEACEGFDTDTITHAIMNFRSGLVEGHNASFAPPEPLFSRELRSVLNTRLKWDNLDRALQLQIEARDAAERFDTDEKTVENRARVKALVDGTVKSLKVADPEDAARDERVKNLILRGTETVRRKAAWTAGDDQEARDD